MLGLELVRERGYTYQLVHVVSGERGVPERVSQLTDSVWERRGFIAGQDWAW